MAPRTLRGYVAAMAAGALVVLTPAAALADTGGPTDPLGGVLGQVTQQLAPTQAGPSEPALPGTSGLPGPAAPSAPSTQPSSGPSSGPTPASDDDTAPNETTDPSGPDHGAAQALHLGAGGQDVADAGQDQATVRRHGGTRADSTLLALGGQEVLGAHASSSGKKQSHAGDPLKPVCDNSGGQVCLRVLYADAYATDAGGRSHSHSDSGAADVCLGGSSADPTATCGGPVHAGVLRSSATANRNQTTGRTRASSRSDLLDVCLTQPGTSGCALSADAVHSQGHADSGGATPSARRGSFLLGVQGGGQSGRVDQPTAIQVPPGCPPPSALCAYLNQGETYLGDKTAGHAQDALKASALPGQPVEVDVLGGHTETLVHRQPSQTGGEPSAVSGAGGPGHPGSNVLGESQSLSPLAGVLPNTGGVWSGLLALALLAVASGCFLLAFSRRHGQPA